MIIRRLKILVEVNDLKENVECQIAYLQFVERLLVKYPTFNDWQRLLINNHQMNRHERAAICQLMSRHGDAVRLLPKYGQQIFDKLTGKLEKAYLNLFGQLDDLQFKTPRQVVASRESKQYLADGWLIDDVYRFKIRMHDLYLIFDAQLNLPHAIKIKYTFPRRSIFIPMMGINQPYQISKPYGNISIKLKEIINPQQKVVYDHGAIKNAKTVYQQMVDDYNRLNYVQKLLKEQPLAFNQWYAQAVKPSRHYSGDEQLKQKFYSDLGFQDDCKSIIKPEMEQLTDCFNQFWHGCLGYEEIKFGKMQIK